MTYFYKIGKSDYNLTQSYEDCLNREFIINIGNVIVIHGIVIMYIFHIVSKVILINLFECSNNFGVKNGECLKIIVRVITGVIIISITLL
ncbi:hypothetical protein ENUP19_0042G0053 [Entamoeba nuttalli]|uniref:Uncharacterized protein n=1 Tax=Entamoeba nuttalli TaxID=412467 RepID=A0ABQ0DAD0_9EUKA